MSHDPAEFQLASEPAVTVKNGPAGVVGSGDLLGVLEATCEDCMALMARYPDKHFDLAIVDPPYGIGASKGTWGSSNNATVTDYGKKKWDDAIPSQDYFAELRRVSRAQVIWGGNYFPLPPSAGWLVWHKKDTDCDFSDCELAWTSRDAGVRYFRYLWNGYWQGNMMEKEKRIHPTQKPVALYRWILETCAKPGQRILDTHLGSGSHAIAAHYFGAHLTACDIDADYYAAAMARIKRETAQTTLFT